MKGLIIKDIKIIAQRKMFFVLMFAFSIFFSYSNDGSFGVSYFTMICTIFASTTISYDDSENCYPFLVALPVTRKDYVVGKYLLGIIFGCGAWVISVVTGQIVNLVAGKGESFIEFIAASAAIIPAVLILVAIMIPTTLKFGQQGGLIASAAAAAIIFGAVTVIQTRASISTLMIDMEDSFDEHMGLIVVIATVVAAVIYVLSAMISIGIMNKKEL